MIIPFEMERSVKYRDLYLYFTIERVVTMRIPTFLQKITYSTLSFILVLFSVNPFVTIAENESSPEATAITITIVAPEDGTYINTKEMVVSGTINTPDATIQLYLNEELVNTIIEVEEAFWFASLTQLEEGRHKLLAIATNDADEQYYSNEVYVTVDTIVPEIYITNLVDGTYTNKTVIEGQTEANLPVKLYFNGTELEHTSFSDDNGYWSFGLAEFITEGTHVVSATATDLAGNEGMTGAISFTLDQTRPYVLPSIFPRHNMTKVAVDTVVKFNLVDDNILSKDAIVAIPFEVIKKGSNEPVPGTFSINQKDHRQLEVIFKPDSDLEKNQKYYVHTNPFLADQAGNLIHPRIWSFTTTASEGSKNPHGNYTSNVNTCATCHSTHTASQPKLKEPSEELTSLLDQEQAFISYCMACHDGTVAAIPENFGQSSSHHFQLITNEGKVTSQYCGSCHNPHLTWSEKNPNSFQDHFTFEHSLELEGVDKPFFADSKEQLCESCHDKDSLTRKLDERVSYRIFTYKNWNSSSYQLGEEQGTFGQETDYSLCLRCHNQAYQQEYKNIVDIESFYTNENSGHFITADRVKDGSLLNGHLPCADCHNSHGSENIKLIKSEMGHHLKGSFNFSKEEWIVEEGWTSSKERDFCLSCHNNTTELYGITVSLREMNEAGEAINGHELASTDSCATCHGGINQSFLKAVHGPSKQK